MSQELALNGNAAAVASCLIGQTSVAKYMARRPAAQSAS
jgi:hypothetical protein